MLEAEAPLMANGMSSTQSLLGAGSTTGKSKNWDKGGLVAAVLSLA
jgi:hypothetical protein